MRTDAPLSEPKLIARRKKKVKYGVEHVKGKFFITTNEHAVNYKIMQTSVDDLRKSSWKSWMPHDIRRAITGFAPFATFSVVPLREKGMEEIFITQSDASELTKVELPEVAHAITVTGELEYDSSFVRFTYQSFVTPRTVYDFDVEKQKLAVRKVQKVPGWNSKDFTVERLWAKNGSTQVPVSVVYPKNAPKKGTIPFLIDIYGSYGYTNDPYFSISRLSLLKRGWGIAIAHPRGGGEMGWQWHKEAHRTTKHRTYFDSIAVADLLVKKKYTSREELFLSGGSAGGMTLGAIMNIRPDICKGALVYVPDADVVTSSLDTSLGGTLLHYDELGDPRKKKEYVYLKRWSPYENVKKAEYPSMLVRCSMHDIRTPYWEAAKWVARLRAKTTNRGPLLLKTESNAGHGGKSGRYEWIKERAHDYAFLLRQVQ